MTQATNSSAPADVLIIGGGPAGLGAALALSRQMYNTILIDSGKYRNDATSHMHNVPGWDHAHPADYRAAVRKELTGRYHTTKLVSAQIKTLSKLDDGGFQAVDVAGTTYTGKKLVLATGVIDVQPDIEGYEKSWGKSIFHCLFCHGYEERGAQRAGVLCSDSAMLTQKPVAMVIGGMAQRFAETVTLYTQGNATLTKELQADLAASNLKVDDRKIVRVEQISETPADGLKIQFADGQTEELGFLVHAPINEMTGPWADQLGLEMENGNYKLTNMFGETSVPGCFAAGDCATVAKAVATATTGGMMTAAGIAHQVALARI